MNYRAPQNAITYKLSLFLIGGTHKNMLDTIRSMLPYLILWMNGFHSFIDISQFLTSKCYLRDTHPMRDIPPNYPISNPVMFSLYAMFRSLTWHSP